MNREIVLEVVFLPLVHHHYPEERLLHLYMYMYVARELVLM